MIHYLSIVFVTGLFTIDMHPFKISVTEAMYDESDSTIVVNSKIFIDDFEVALQAFAHDKSFRLSEYSNSGNLRELISSYLDSRLELTTHKKINLQLSNLRFDDLVIWCEQRSKGVEPFNKIEIKNTILVDTFETQQNLFKIKKSGSGEKGIRSNKRKSKDVIFW